MIVSLFQVSAATRSLTRRTTGRTWPPATSTPMLRAKPWLRGPPGTIPRSCLVRRDRERENRRRERGKG